MQMKDYTERQKEFHFLLSLKFLNISACCIWEHLLFNSTSMKHQNVQTSGLKLIVRGTCLIIVNFLKKKKKLDRRTNPCTILRVRINSC